MKKKFLLLPLVGMLLTSCSGTVVPLEEMPELVKPGNFLTSYSIKIDMEFDDFIVDDTTTLDGTASTEESAYFYANYATMVTKGFADFDGSEIFDGVGSLDINLYLFNQDGYTYSLEHYKFIEDDVLEEDKAGYRLTQTAAAFESYILEGVESTLNDEYWPFMEAAYKFILELDLLTLTPFEYEKGLEFSKKGDVYKSKIVGTYENYVSTMKHTLTFKDDILMSLVEETVVTFNKKTISEVTTQIMATFAEELPTYQGSFPNIAEYTFSGLSIY